MRKAFTLLELMLAIVILGLIVTFLMQTTGSLQQGQNILSSKVEAKGATIKMIKLLHEDLFSGTDMNITESDDYSMIALRTQSSIYGINHPYVRWFADPKKKILLRSESSKPYLPPFDNEKLFEIHLDAVAECEWFKAVPSSNRGSLLLGMKCDQTPMVFELLTPQFEVVKKVSKP